MTLPRRLTAADYINTYNARKSPWDMVPPWRHSNPVIRALYWHREMWMQAEIIEGLGRDPSCDLDVATDAYDAAAHKRRTILTEAWSRRQHKALEAA